MKSIHALVFAVFFLPLFSCGSTTTKFDPSAGGLSTVDAINYNDFADAAGYLVQDMLSSGVFDTNVFAEYNGRCILVLEDVTNETRMHGDTKVLTDKVRIALLKSGKVVTTTGISTSDLGRGPEDTSARKLRQLGKGSDLVEDANLGQIKMPSVSLSGSLIAMSADASGFLGAKTQERVFIFKLTLTDVRTALAYWEGERPIGKRKTQGFLGG